MTSENKDPCNHGYYPVPTRDRKALFALSCTSFGWHCNKYDLIKKKNGKYTYKMDYATTFNSFEESHDKLVEELINYGK